MKPRFFMEPLEGRCLFSGFQGGDGFAGPGGYPNQSEMLTAIQFTQAPTAVKTGLTQLAATDGVAAPASTATVHLDNEAGIESYSVTTATSAGVITRLTVDQNGKPVTAPTVTTTTWAALSGASGDSAATTEISAIANAHGLTAPTGTTVVDVITYSSGAITYSVRLSDSATMWPSDAGVTISVDSAGNPVGNQNLPFSLIPAAIQAALNARAPAGATPLAANSTSSVSVRVLDGINTYSVVFTSAGTQTTVTVDIAGNLITQTVSTTTFGTLSSTVRAELQALATANGVTGTISSTQSVNVVTEATGAIIYGVTLTATETSSSGQAETYNLTFAVDAAGNPTTTDRNSSSDAASNCSGGSSANSSSSSSGDSSSTAAGNTSLTPVTSSASSPAAAAATSTTSATTYTDVSAGEYLTAAKFSAGSAYSGLNDLTGAIYLAAFSPTRADAAVTADLQQIRTDHQALNAYLASLTSAERTTYQSDRKAVRAAIIAAAGTLKALRQTLNTDLLTWHATLRADNFAVRRDRNNPAALSTDRQKLASDQAAAFTAVSTDQTALQAAITGNSAVKTAEAKLAGDFPTIAADEAKLQSDFTQLLKDIKTQLSSATTTTTTSTTAASFAA